MLPTAAVVEAPLTLPRLPLTWVAVVWLGVLGSFIASMLYLTLIQDVGPTRAMLTTYLFPLIGAALGAIFLHEQQGWQGGLLQSSS
jgi:drug/metabolite transporter (DMT)-like permease